MKYLNTKTLIILLLFILSSCNNVNENIIENENNSGSIEKNIEENSLNEDEEKFLGAGYYKKIDGIYYFDDKLKNADKDTFHLLYEPIYSEYALDKDNAYGFGNYLDGADLNNFEVLSFRYAKDKDNVYCFGEKLDGADSSSFINTDSWDTYAIDKNNVYFNCNLVTGADNESFEVFRGGEGIAKDKDNVYCGDEKQNGVDIETYSTFYVKTTRGEILSDYSKDKNHVYYNCRYTIKEADSESFEVINPFFAKDKNYVYHYNQIIKGVDPNNYNLEELEKIAYK